MAHPYTRPEPFTLRQFVKESNRIEGYAGVHRAEIQAHKRFLAQKVVTREGLEAFVTAVTGTRGTSARLRDGEGLNVVIRSGGRVVYEPPAGGPRIVAELERILDLVNNKAMTSYGIHQLYEGLHPFTDGNGRSGRVLWLWDKGGIEHARLGFLHHFYYEALQAYRLRTDINRVL